MRGRWLMPLLLLTACGGGSGPAEPVTETEVTDPPMLLATLQSGIEDELRIAIRDPADWLAFWSELRAAGAGVGDQPPAVDFRSSMVVVASLGTRERTGYSVRIAHFRATPDSAVVTVGKTAPAGACPTSPVIITPLAMAVLPVAREIRYIEVEQPVDC
jgi:hypothetical protein